MLWGRCKTGIAEEDVVGKEDLQEFLELLGGALFKGEDACQPYAMGHPMSGASSCNDAVRPGQEREQIAAGKL